MKLKRSDMEKLVNSFRAWGKRLLGRALDGAKKYGILCSSTDFSNGMKG